MLTRAVEPGQIVQPGRALLTLALSGRLQLVAAVDERYLQQLQPGQAASVRADAFPEQRFTAQVLTISPLVDAQRGAVEVKLSVAAPPAYLREDMTLSVEVETGKRERALVVPVTALRAAPANVSSATASAQASANASATTATIGITGPGGTTMTTTGTVWLARDGRVEARSVRLGLRTLEAVEVSEGLVAGDSVLIGPAPAPGARVKADLVTATWGQGAGQSGPKGTPTDPTTALSNSLGR